LRSTDRCGARETDPKLHRFINGMFLRMIASAESEPLGRRGYDLRQAMEERLDKLQAISRQ
jgi:hypothetical protein